MDEKKKSASDENSKLEWIKPELYLAEFTNTKGKMAVTAEFTGTPMWVIGPS